MLEALKQWRLKRRMKQAITTAINDHRAIIAKGWTYTTATTSDDRARIADEAQAWLASQLPYAATPHGISRYAVSIGFAAMDGAHRTYLGQNQFPPFNRLEAMDAFEQVRSAIQALDLTTMPTITTLEVYMLSYGNALKNAFNHD